MLERRIFQIIRNPRKTGLLPLISPLFADTDNLDFLSVIKFQIDRYSILNKMATCNNDFLLKVLERFYQNFNF